MKTAFSNQSSEIHSWAGSETKKRCKKLFLKRIIQKNIISKVLIQPRTNIWDDFTDLNKKGAETLATIDYFDFTSV